MCSFSLSLLGRRFPRSPTSNFHDYLIGQDLAAWPKEFRKGNLWAGKEKGRVARKKDEKILGGGWNSLLQPATINY